MGYKKTIIFVALLFVFLVLFLLWYLLKQSKRNTSFPPNIGICPDYFVAEESVLGGVRETRCKQGSVKQTLAKNICKVGNSNDYFNIAGLNNNRERKKRADECQISWDGITNVN